MHREDLLAVTIGGSRHPAIVVVKFVDLPETISAHGLINSISAGLLTDSMDLPRLESRWYMYPRFSNRSHGEPRTFAPFP